MFNRLPILIVFIALTVIGAGCTKEKDVVPPFGSTINMNDETVEISRGQSRGLSAVVLGPNSMPMNGVGVIFRSSSTRASFSYANSGVTQTKGNTDNNGTVTVTVFANTTGTATIYGDIKVASDEVEVTIK